LEFPLSAILQDDTRVRYSMEGVTDLNRWQHDGYGVWFSAYFFAQINLRDTLGASISFVYDTIEPIIDPGTGDTLNLDEIHDTLNIDSFWFVTDTFRVIFGSDTLTLDVDSVTHISTTWELIYAVDTTYPFVTRSVDSLVFDTVPHLVNLDIFMQDNYDFPDFSDWGWQYKGWITSEYIDSTAIGKFTPPAWDYDIGGENNIPGDQGGLLTTGTFSRVDEPDDSDPYTFLVFDRVDSLGNTIYKRPMVPGEDFLDVAALNADGIPNNGSGVDLMPGPNMSRYASVFISLEPVNRVSDTTNFPLIPYFHKFPDTWPDPFGRTWVTMHNWTKTVTGTSGFPLVTARIQRL